MVNVCLKNANTDSNGGNPVHLFTFPPGVLEDMPSTVTGYHGTLAESARTIVAQQRMNKSKNSYDWLGDGVYFWQDYREHAKVWAFDNYPGQKVGILKTSIDLGTCLDFPSRLFESMRIAAIVELERRCNAGGRPMPVNKGKNFALDRETINLLCQNFDRTIDSVRDNFAEDFVGFGSPHGLRSHTHLCVRTVALIGQIELIGEYYTPSSPLMGAP